MSESHQVTPETIKVDVGGGIELLASFKEDLKQYVVHCDMCNTMVKLGPHGAGNSLHQHRGKRSCQKAAWKNKQSEARNRLRDPALPQNPEDVQIVDTSFESAFKAYSMRRQICPGVLVSWSAGSIWDTYPFQLHVDHSWGWEPIAFVRETNQLRLRARNCARICSVDDHPCAECSVIPHSSRYKTFVTRANNAQEGTSWDYLNARQLKGLVQKYASRCNQMRRQLDTAQRRCDTIKKKLDQARHGKPVLDAPAVSPEESQDCATLITTFAATSEQGIVE